VFSCVTDCNFNIVRCPCNGLYLTKRHLNLHIDITLHYTQQLHWHYSMTETENCGCWDMQADKQTDRQTDRHTHHNAVHTHGHKVTQLSTKDELKGEKPTRLKKWLKIRLLTSYNEIGFWCFSEFDGIGFHSPINVDDITKLSKWNDLWLRTYDTQHNWHSPLSTLLSCRTRHSTIENVLWL